LRVVHLGKYYPPASGGIETHTQTLARGLAARGIEVTVVVANHATTDGRDVTFEKWLRTDSSENFDGPIRIRRAGRVANMAKLDVAPDLAGILKDELKNPPDLWHLHTPNITMMLAVLAFRAIRPLAITHHSDIIKQKVLKHVIQPFETALYRRAKLLLATSPPYIDGSSILTRFRAKTDSLPLGIHLEPYLNPNAVALEHAERFRRDIAGPIWLSVGRLIYYKGLGTAIQALKTVPGTLVVVGTGPMEATWKAEAEAAGVANRIVWKGRTPADELVGLYRAATAHWFPSNARSEGYGLVQVEAMAAGCPTINTAVPHSGVSWVCKHEIAGLTVPMNDAPAFAAAATRLLNEPGLRDRLSRDGIREAETRFRDTVMAERCEDFYRRVVNA